MERNRSGKVFLPQVIGHVQRITVVGAEERGDSLSAFLRVFLWLNDLFGYSTPHIPGGYDKTMSQAPCRCNKDMVGAISGRIICERAVDGGVQEHHRMPDNTNNKRMFMIWRMATHMICVVSALWRLDRDDCSEAVLCVEDVRW